jgi:hypothetical protein
MFNSKAMITWLGFILIVGLLTGCAPKSTPPGDNSISGVAEGARYSYHYWDEGLALLFWYDFSSGGGGCVGSGSTEDPVYRLECDVDNLAGQRVKWLAETTDGVAADLWIDGRQYDLANGTMFLIATRGNSLQIEQVARDLSQLAPDVDELAALATEDPAVIDFIAQMTGDAVE